jgi:hypothetical protein
MIYFFWSVGEWVLIAVSFYDSYIAFKSVRGSSPQEGEDVKNKSSMISIENILKHWVTKYFLLLLGFWLALPQPKRNIIKNI